MTKGRNAGGPTDAQTLQITIQHKRTSSKKDERGKGLSSMIELIDRFRSGSVMIVSGDAFYTYGRVAEIPVPAETCEPLGAKFPGTMIVWKVDAPLDAERPTE